MVIEVGLTQQQAVDDAIRKAIVGAFVHVPTIGSRVYYFPDVHAEQATSPPHRSPLLFLKLLIQTRVLSVRHFEDPDTGEIFFKIRLAPISENSTEKHHVAATDAVFGKNQNERQEEVLSCIKILITSATNLSGGFTT